MLLTLKTSVRKASYNKHLPWDITKNKSVHTSTEIISDPGISNIASKSSFSNIALNPLAPVFLLIAFRAITLSAASVNVKST